MSHETDFETLKAAWPVDKHPIAGDLNQGNQTNINQMKKLQSIAAIALLVGAASFAVVGCKHMQSSEASASGASYPLTKCVVSGEALDDKPYIFVHNGQQ